MLAPDITKTELEQTLIRLANELPPERLVEVIDFAIFVKSLVNRELKPVRTPEQLEALKQLFSGPKRTGLYAALMRERAAERARDNDTQSTR